MEVDDASAVPCAHSPVPAQMWQGPAQARRRCGRGRAPVPAQMWQGASPVLVQMWPGWAQSWCRYGSGEPSPGADVAGVSPAPVQMWALSGVGCGQGQMDCTPDARVVPKEQLDELLVRHARLRAKGRMYPGTTE